MSETLRELEPRLIWEHFEGILKVPRPSGREEKIRKWLISWSKSKNFNTTVDKAGNLIINVPATSGYEKSPVVVLQAHMDMVCEKNEDMKFNFDKDSIKVSLVGDWLITDGTTMGADDGIGIAAALAAAVDPDAVHGPLELLFTVDEETGLTGAFNMASGILKGKILLNLDSEEEGTFFVGCAGGGDTHIQFPFAYGKPIKGKGIRVKVAGMKGGHSGLNIHENRANAIKIAARMLRDAREKDIRYSLISINGGDKHNAIPRECTFDVVVAKKQVGEFKNFLNHWKDDIFHSEFKNTDPHMRIEFNDIKRLPTKALSNVCRDKLLALLVALPHGVTAMSRDIEGMVETSNNLASIHSKKKGALIVTSSRSSVASALQNIRDAIYEIAAMSGSKVDEKPGYPGWQPNMDSQVLSKAMEVYKNTFGKDPNVTAVHAGLECGILGEKHEGMDMLSFGPTLSGVHSPDEKVHVGSVRNFYKFLKALLESLT